MTEIVSIRQDVINPDYHSRTQYRSHFSRSAFSTVPYKRKILDRWTGRITASGLPGNELVTEYLHGKYIKNLSVRTIVHAGGVILSFMHFFNKKVSSILTLTRSDISAFVEYGQDRGLMTTSIISHLRVIYAFIMYLVEQEAVAPEIMKPKIRLQEPDALPKAIPREDIELILDAITSVRDRALIMLLLRTGMRISMKVEPIRAVKDIRLIKKLLADKPRDLAIFCVGINSALRASEILMLTVGHARTVEPGREIVIVEKKTGKERIITANHEVAKVLRELYEYRLETEKEIEDGSPLFVGQRGPIRVPTVCKLVKTLCAEINLEGNYSSPVRKSRRKWDNSFELLGLQAFKLNFRFRLSPVWVWNKERL